MKNSIHRISLFSAVLLSIIVFHSCEGLLDETGMGPPTEADIEGAKQKVINANKAFGEAVRQARDQIFNSDDDINESVDKLDDITGFKTARDLYIEATQFDPNNLDARLGVAVTQIIILKDDDELRSLRDQWIDFGENQADDVGLPQQGLFKISFPTGPNDLAVNEKRFSNSVLKASKKLIFNPPLASEMQRAMQNIVIPSLDISIGSIQKVIASDSADSYTFIVSSQMQGGTEEEPEDPVELDLTDFKAFFASLLLARANTRMFLAYNLDVDVTDSTAIVEALSQMSDFFTLKDGEEVRKAKDDLIRSADLMLEAIQFLRAETDNQDDDFITIDPDPDIEGIDVEPDDLDEIELRIMQARDALNGEVTLTEDFDENADTPDADLTVSLQAFFDNPPERPKELLPSYIIERDEEHGVLVDQFVWTAQTIAAWQFPDPTFGGILPGMTNQRLKEIFGVEFVPGDIDLTISGGTTPTYSWNGGPIAELFVSRLDLGLVWAIRNPDHNNAIFSPVIHGSVPANAVAEDLHGNEELVLTPGQLYRVHIFRGGAHHLSGSSETRDFIVQ